MLKTGLVSVTFREKSTEQIIALTHSAGLESIEWGGDVHVPPGRFALAQQVQQQTIDAGLTVSAYGSYYRLGETANFEAVLDTAEALNAPIIRVWAGTSPSADADDAYWGMICADANRTVEQASQRGISISLEHHEGTLTDTTDSAQRLLQQVDELRTFWQPPHTPNLQEKIQSLQALLPWMTNVHVFQWHPESRERFPLVDGEDDWKQYIDLLRRFSGDHTLSLEFVHGDDETQLFKDAATLKRWLAS